MFFLPPGVEPHVSDRDPAPGELAVYQQAGEGAVTADVRDQSTATQEQVKNNCLNVGGQSSVTVSNDSDHCHKLHRLTWTACNSPWILTSVTVVFYFYCISVRADHQLCVHGPTLSRVKYVSDFPLRLMNVENTLCSNPLTQI